jgi:glutamine amidotransferase PdxT
MTSTRIERFHQSYPGTADLYHTYSSDHPAWGTCTELAEAHMEVADHLKKAHKEA